MSSDSSLTSDLWHPACCGNLARRREIVALWGTYTWN